MVSRMLEFGLESFIQLDMAASACAAHMEAENTMKAWPIREIFLPLNGFMCRVKFLHKLYRRSLSPAGGDGRHSDRVWYQSG